MNELGAYIVGIKIEPDTEKADLYSAWYEREDETVVFQSVEGRVQWSRSVSAAFQLASAQLGDRYEIEPELHRVCDVAHALYAVSSGERGEEPAVLETLNFLYDLMNTIPRALELPNARVLDVAVGLLTEGEPLDLAVEKVGGKAAVIEPIFGTLGRVFAFSTFRD